MIEQEKPQWVIDIENELNEKIEQAKKDIIEAAAKIIREEIKKATTTSINNPLY